MAKAVNCPRGVEVCIVYKDEPLWKRAYFVNMTGKNIRTLSGTIWTNMRASSLQGRVFNKYSKTIIAEEQKIKNNITGKMNNITMWHTSFDYRFE